jgi:hypothetical protein
VYDSRMLNSKRAHALAFLTTLLLLTVGTTAGWSASLPPLPKIAPLPPLAANGIHITAQIALDRQPGNPAVGFGSVWIPSSATGILDRVDPRSGKLIARIRSSLTTTATQNQYFDSVAVSADAVWHASDAGNIIVRVSPSRNRVVKRIPVGGRPDEIAAGPSGVYVSLFNDSVVERIDPQTNKVVRRVSLGGPAMGVAYGAHSVWALTSKGPTVLQLDPLTLAVKRRISIKSNAPFLGGYFSAWWIAADEAGACASNQQQNSVTTIDLTAPKVVAQTILPFGGVPFSVAITDGSCWVANGSGVFKISSDGSSIAFSHLPPLGPSAFVGIATGAGAAWVTSAGRNALLKVE